MTGVNAISYSFFGIDDIGKDPGMIIPLDRHVEDHIKLTYAGCMGSTKCLTCGQIENLCSGHWMLMETNDIFYIKSYYKLYMKLNKIVCLKCKDFNFIYSHKLTKILQNPSHKRYKEAYDCIRYTINRKSGKPCERCERPPLSMYCNKKDLGIKYNVLDKDGKKKAKYITGSELYEILSNIPDVYHGFIMKDIGSLTKYFYRNYIPISPMFTRPSVVSERTSSYNASKITSGYVDFGHELIKFKKLTDYKAKKKCIIDAQNKLNQLIQPGKFRDLASSFTEIHMTKNNLMKLINSVRGPGSGRVVLGTWPSISINESYPCRETFYHMTYRVFYNRFSKDLIMFYIESGKISGYGQKTPSGFKYTSKAYTIRIIESGDYIETRFEPGLPIMSLRYPALHSSSISMGIAVDTQTSVLNKQTHRLTSAVITGHGADFDGDEINIKIESSSPKANYEQYQKLLPGFKLFSPGNGGLNYGLLLEEQISLSFILHQEISFRRIVHLMGPLLGYFQKRFPGRESCTGAELMSTMIPAHLNKPGYLESGIITLGAIRGAHVNAGAGSVHSIAKVISDMTSRMTARMFIESLMVIAKNAISTETFGINISDYVREDTLWKEIKQQYNIMYGQICNNYRSYKKSVHNGTVVAMDSDREASFLKIELGKLDVYIRKLIESKILSKWRIEYNNFLEDRFQPYSGLYIPTISSSKITPDLLMKVFCHISSNVNIGASHYMNRISPIYNINYQDLQNYGRVNSSLLQGGIRFFVEMFLLAVKANSNIVATTCDTGDSGDSGRAGIKKLENYVIDNKYRFVVMNNMILWTCLNMYKLPNNQLHIVSIDHARVYSLHQSNNALHVAILQIYKKIYKFIMDPITGKVSDALAYPTDIEIILYSNHTVPIQLISNEQALHRVVQFWRMIHRRYMFCFGSVDLAIFITLYYVSKFHEIDQRQLDELFKIIENKYKKYPDYNNPIGMTAGMTIAEVHTQNVISSHQDIDKGGRTITSKSSNNDDLLKINVNSKKPSSTIQFISKDLIKLLCIKTGLEYLTLEDIGTYKIDLIDKKTLRCNIKLNQSAIKVYGIGIQVVEIMISNLINTTGYIALAELTTNVEDNTMMLDVHLTSRRYINLFKMIFGYGVSKGIFSMFRFRLDTRDQFDIDIFENSKEYRLLAHINDIDILMDFDTRDIKIIPGIIFVSRLYGQSHGYNMLSNLYNSSELGKFNTTLLAKHQKSTGTILGLRKSNRDIMTTLSKTAFSMPLDDMQRAVMYRSKEHVSSHTDSAFVGNLVRVGTGGVNSYVDMSLLYQKKSCLESQL